MNAELLDFLPLIIIGGLLVAGAGIFGWIHTTRLKIRHGYPLENMWGMPMKPATDAEAQERVRLLTQENAAMRAELGAAKDRLAVVERIVTDKGFDVARQIETLRDSSVN